MRARRTPWWWYVIAVAVGGLLGWSLVRFTRTAAIAPVGASWLTSGLLLAVGVAVLVLAWQVRQYAHGKTRRIDPDKAVTTLILCKSLALAGALLAGYYGGQLVMCLVWIDVEFYHSVIWECVAACAVTVADTVAGIVGEGWCQLPPGEGPEHPNQKKRKGQAPAAVSEDVADRR